MKRLTYFVVWLLLWGMVSGAWAGAEGEIAQVREQFGQAFNAGNVEALGALLGEDIQYFPGLSPFRVDGREAVLALWADFFRGLPTRTLLFRQPSVRLYGDATAVDAGYFQFTGLDPKGQVTTLFGRYTITYVKQGGKWVIVSLHGSRLPLSP